MKNRRRFRLAATIAASILGGAAVQGGDGAAAAFKPTWSPRQSWNVEVERMTEAPALPKSELVNFKAATYRLRYRLEFEGTRDVDGEACSSVRIECVGAGGAGASDDLYYRVFLRESDGTLKLVQRLRKSSATVEASRMFEPGPVDATDWAGFLPLAFPSFAAGASEREPAARKSKDGKVEFRHSDRCRQSQAALRAVSKGKEVDALRVVVEDDATDVLARRTAQTWIKGAPWWQDATCERDGRRWCSARLVEE